MQSCLRFIAVLFAALFLAGYALAHEEHLPQVGGIIKKVDVANATVTIQHGPIPNLNMSAMTMSFKVRDPAQLAPWKAGDRVLFRCADVKGVLTVISIEAAK